MRGMKYYFRNLIGNSDEKRPFLNLGGGWDDNIKRGLKEIGLGCEEVDFNPLVLDSYQ
jgi:hypothetical protein